MMGDDTPYEWGSYTVVPRGRAGRVDPLGTMTAVSANK